MERRVLIAIFLSFIVLYVYQALVVKPVPKPTNGTTTSATQPPGSAPPPAAAPNLAPLPIQAPAAVQPTARALVGDTEEREIRVETSDVIAVFTNRGAR